MRTNGDSYRRNHLRALSRPADVDTIGSSHHGVESRDTPYAHRRIKRKKRHDFECPVLYEVAPVSHFGAACAVERWSCPSRRTSEAGLPLTRVLSSASNSFAQVGPYPGGRPRPCRWRSHSKEDRSCWRHRRRGYRRTGSCRIITFKARKASGTRSANKPRLSFWLMCRMQSSRKHSTRTRYRTPSEPTCGTGVSIRMRSASIYGVCSMGRRTNGRRGRAV